MSVSFRGGIDIKEKKRGKVEEKEREGRRREKKKARKGEGKKRQEKKKEGERKRKEKEKKERRKRRKRRKRKKRKRNIPGIDPEIFFPIPKIGDLLILQILTLNSTFFQNRKSTLISTTILPHHHLAHPSAPISAGKEEVPQKKPLRSSITTPSQTPRPN